MLLSLQLQLQLLLQLAALAYACAVRVSADLTATARPRPPPPLPPRPPRPPASLGVRGGGSSLVEAAAPPLRVYRPHDYGADETGQRDSLPAFQRLVTAAWATAAAEQTGCLQVSSRCLNTTNLGGVIIDLAGGSYLLRAPLVFPPSGGGNFGLQDGTLRAGHGFPRDRFLLELNVSASEWPDKTFVDATFSNLVLDGNDVAAGLSCTCCDHVTYDRIWITRFQRYGLYTLNGHENYLSNSWISQSSADRGGTGVAMQSADSSVVDTVIFNCRLGFYVNAGNSVLSNVHIYNTGHHAWANESAGFDAAPFGGGYIKAHGVRLLGVYFDDCTLVIDNPQHVTITNGLWLLGQWTATAALILRPIPSIAFGEPPVMKGLTVRGNYVETAASFSDADYTGASFVLLAEDASDGESRRFDPATVAAVSIGDNDASKVAAQVKAGSYFVRSTEARQSLYQTNASVWRMDFSRQLLFPGSLNYVSATFAQDFTTELTMSPVRHTVRYDRGSSVVEVVLENRASGLASVEVRQGDGTHFRPLKTDDEDPCPPDKRLANGICLPEVWPPTIELHANATPEPPPYITSPPAVIDISLGRQLLVDDFLLEPSPAAGEHGGGWQRDFHTASWQDATNPVLTYDRAWEFADAGAYSGGVWHGYSAVNRSKPVFKMWYNCGTNVCSGVKVRGHPCNGTQHLPMLCYAESDDGMSGWEKPLIGQEVDGISGKTNVVLQHVNFDSSTVWVETPDEKLGAQTYWLSVTRRSGHGAFDTGELPPL